MERYGDILIWPCRNHLTYKIFSGLYLGNHKEQEVDTWFGHWMRVVGVQYHDVTLI